MKKLNFLLLLLLSISFLVTSCKDDKEEITYGVFSVNGVEYPITRAEAKGYKSKNSSTDHSYTFDLYSLQGDITRKIRLSISYPINETIQGSYSLVGSSRQIDSWSSGYYETEAKNTQSYINLIKGSGTVERMDGYFRLKFNLEPQSGHKIKLEMAGNPILSE